MKISYIGIDFLDEALKTVLGLPAVEVMKIFVCPTDNKTEFNTEVISLAKQNGIEWTDKRITEDDIVSLKNAGCEAIICAGYYYKIPVSGVLPIINIHPSLLPVGRGAWPMPVTILKRLSESGVTLHKMTAALDEGDIILQERFDVSPDENLKSFSEKQSVIISRLVTKLFEDFDGCYSSAYPQDASKAEYWDNPSEKDWTVTAADDFESADRILRAFYGYECIYRDDACSYEMIDAAVFRQREDIPDGQRYFETDDGFFISAPRIKRYGEEITFELREKVDAIRKKYGDTSSVWAFQSLYIWRKAMKLKIVLDDDFAVVNCASRGDNTWFFPLGDEEKCVGFIKENLCRDDFALIYTGEKQLEMLNRHFPGVFTSKRSDGDDEYICGIDGHLTLIGKNYASLRTQLHKASRDHTIELVPLSDDKIGKAVEMLKKCHSSGKSWLNTDRVTAAVLAEHVPLGTEIYLTYVDGVLSGTIGGFPIDSETFDCCLAQETVRYQGVSYAVKHRLFELLSDRYRYVNFEEDLGIEGLRFMKNSLAPIRKTEFWDVKRN